MRTDPDEQRRLTLVALDEPGALDAANAALAKRTILRVPWWRRFGAFVAQLWRRRRGPVNTAAFGTMDAVAREQMVDFARATGDEPLLRGLRLVRGGKR